MKQSLKCVMRWGPHHQCPGYVVVSITEQASQHLIPLNILEELTQFQFWTIFFLSLTSGLVHINPPPCFSWSILGTSVLVTEDLVTVSSVVMKVEMLYAVDLPNVSSLSGEIHNWYTKKNKEKHHGSNSLPSTLSSTLTRIFRFYTNIKALVTILYTFPITYALLRDLSVGLRSH